MIQPIIITCLIDLVKIDNENHSISQVEKESSTILHF